MSFWLFLLRLKKWKERPKLPRAERVSVLDEIIRSDWYRPKKRNTHEHQNDKHGGKQDQGGTGG